MADFIRNSNNPRSRPWLHPPPIPFHRIPPFSSVPFFPQSTFGPIFLPTPQGFINPPPDPPGFASFRRPPNYTTPFPNATPSGPGPYDFTHSASRFFTPYSYPNLPPPPQLKANGFSQTRSRGQLQWQQNQTLANRPLTFGPGRRGTGVFHSPQTNHLPNNITPTHKKNKPIKRRGRRNRKGGVVEASPQMRKQDGFGKQEECPQHQHVLNYEMVLPKEWPY